MSQRHILRYIQNFDSECLHAYLSPHRIINSFFHESLIAISTSMINYILRTYVRREYNNAVLKVYLCPLAVSDLPIIKHLQHNIEYIQVRL